MTVKEILAKENGKDITCYKQGAFWVCYEQSAYLVYLLKNFKPTKKFIKKCNQDVITVGFPNSIMKQLIVESNANPILDNEKKCVIKCNKIFVANDYKLWKNNVSMKHSTKYTLEPNLEKQILDFPLATQTPIDAFMFIQKLQTQLQNN